MQHRISTVNPSGDIDFAIVLFFDKSLILISFFGGRGGMLLWKTISTFNAAVGSRHVVCHVSVAATWTCLHRLCPKPSTLLVSWTVAKHFKRLLIGERQTAVTTVVTTTGLTGLAIPFWDRVGWALGCCLLGVVCQVSWGHSLPSWAVHSVAKVTAPHTCCGDLYIFIKLSTCHCVQKQGSHLTTFTIVSTLHVILCSCRHISF